MLSSFVLVILGIVLSSDAFVIDRKTAAAAQSLASNIGFAQRNQDNQAAVARVTATKGFGTKHQPIQPKLRSLAGGHTGSGTKALRKAALNFDALRKQHGADCCNDVYVRAPLDSRTTFWFVGKLVIDPARATFAQAAICQKRLIFEYSKSELRPQNLGGQQPLELWLAPGDSEMDTVQNKNILVAVAGSAADLPINLDADAVGYNPEIYLGEERKADCEFKGTTKGNRSNQSLT
jgi:hypothetical protein